ncbi:MAG: RluA family pseudouridine synthase [Bacteroidetes bacterium]|nr:RluA family pseudouridine synthase [Bacteroidota bacterium]
MKLKNQNISDRILYEDNHLIIINKKTSEIVQGDKTGDAPLSETIKEYLREKYNKKGNIFVGVIHRIDRPVSGCVLFAKTDKALTRMNKLIHDRAIKKTYWAVVKNKPPKESDRLLHYLSKNEKQNKSYSVKKDDKNASKAELDYTIIGKSDMYYLLEIELHTGRHHQIRAQLAEIGCPIKGDLKYGYPRSNKDAGIHLHARTIEFIHPVKNEKIKVVAQPPDDPLWNYFVSKQFGT